MQAKPELEPEPERERERERLGTRPVYATSSTEIRSRIPVLKKYAITDIYDLVTDAGTRVITMRAYNPFSGREVASLIRLHFF